MIKAVASVAGTVIALTSGYVAAKPLEAEFDKGYLTFTSEDGSYQMKIDGRIMLDTGFVDADENDIKSETEFRRARLAFKTSYDNTWTGEFDIDFSGNESEIKDMWLAYVGIPNVTLKVGNHKPFFSMAETTTSRWYTFLEVPMVVDTFGTGRRVGISASYWQDRYFVGGTVFGDEVGVNNADEETSESYGVAMRGVYRPWLVDGGKRFIHLGFNLISHAPQSDDENEIKFNARNESRVADYKFLDTGKMGEVDNTTTYGLELAGKYDRWMLQAEYMNTEVNRDSGEPDYEADGFYVEGSYFLVGTGRSYNLDDGEFGPVLPSGEYGDLELALRFSTLDLNDESADIYGGSADSWTIGLNWYAHTNVVFA